MTWIRLRVEVNSSLNVTKYTNTRATCRLFYYSFSFVLVQIIFWGSLLFSQFQKMCLLQKANEVKSNCDFDLVIIIPELKVLISVHFKIVPHTQFFHLKNGIFEIEFNRLSIWMHVLFLLGVAMSVMLVIKRPILFHFLVLMDLFFFNLLHVKNEKCTALNAVVVCI